MFVIVFGGYSECGCHVRERDGTNESLQRRVAAVVVVTASIIPSQHTLERFAFAWARMDTTGAGALHLTFFARVRGMNGR